MWALVCFVLAILTLPFKSKGRLEAENAALRHQVIVLRRQVQGRVHLTNLDRLFLVQLYRCFPSILRVLRHRSAGDPRALASGWVPLLLAMEITIAGRAAAN